MRANPFRLSLLAVLVAGFAAGCGTDDTQSPDDEGLALGTEDPELGKALFDPAAEADAKEDNLRGALGLAESADRSSTAVWEVTNAWEDTATAAAKKAGVAWEADSGLDWNAKYALWVDSMPKVDSQSYFKTYEMRTPYGKTLPAPAVECAETMIFLRATFASWYHLPFFLEATDGRGNRLYLGHFGFRTANGKYANSPDFKTNYKDFSNLADRWEAEGWPTDSRLRGRKLGGSQDDFQPALFEGARAGAYFDELFLNKRVGYFMIFALSYFGSMNLADPKNTFNLKPEAIRAGDGLIERWQRRGIGHTLVVKHVEKQSEDAFQVELVSGSMPRRQGKWESASASKGSFTNEYTGSLGTNWDGEIYAKLGGGLKRWRSAKLVNGRWTNVVVAADQGSFIDAGDAQLIGERVETFDRILREVPPEEKREVLRMKIADARLHLERYPASCSARENREKAFSELYDLESEHFGRTHKDVDLDNRTLADFVFAELVYVKSKTCCWNSTTSAMYEIAMLKAAKDIEDHSANECREPTVFMNTANGYDAFRTFAEELGRGDEWVEWSEDELCTQRDVRDDTQAEHEGTPWCEIGHALSL